MNSVLRRGRVTVEAALRTRGTGAYNRAHLEPFARLSAGQAVSRPPVLAGEAGNSLLIEAWTGEKGSPRSCRPERKPVTEEEIAIVRRWTDQRPAAPEEQACGETGH